MVETVGFQFALFIATLILYEFLYSSIIVLQLVTTRIVTSEHHNASELIYSAY